MRLLKPTAIVGGFTLLSRIIGLGREILMAAALGAGPIADAFFTAFAFPNTFRRIFAEGAFNSAFIPLYARRLQGEGGEEARLFANEVASTLITTLIILVVVAQILMPWLMYALGPGFVSDPDLFGFAILLAQVMMPYLLFISVTAMLGGILNSHDRFAAAAAAPVLFNLVLIAILVFTPYRGETLALALSIGVTVSGVLQAGVLYLLCRRSGIRLKLSIPRLTPGVRRLLTLGAPGAFAAGVTNINILISGSIATLQEGGRSWLNYAERLYQLPLGVVGIAMGVALLPALAKRLRAGDDIGAANGMNRALEISLALTLPAAMAMAVMPEFITSGLFERGAFTAHDARQSAWALMAFAFGLPAFILIKVFSPGFFAREDTVTPMRFAVFAILLNIVLGASLFFGGAGFIGLAIAGSVAGWINAVMLGLTLHRRGLFRADERLRRKLVAILISTAAMGLAVTAMAYAREQFAVLMFGSVTLALLAACGFGAVVYGVAALLTGALRPSEMKDALKRG